MTGAFFCHELRRSRLAFVIWTVAIGSLVAVCVLLYPEMEGEMQSMSALFASMGAFSTAFGMDRMEVGSFLGFYGLECGNVLGLGGALFAASVGVAALEKEEREHTAEFLFTHPVGRARVVAAKGAAVAVQVLALNAAVFAASVGCTAAIGQAIPWRELTLLHAAWLLLQLELAGLCFGLSALVRRGAQGIGLGVAAAAYFLDLIANVAQPARFLKHITPFAYAAPADILAENRLDPALILPGLAAGAVCALLGGWYYTRKDLKA